MARVAEFMTRRLRQPQPEHQFATEILDLVG
jgi:hypothetical protein